MLQEEAISICLFCLSVPEPSLDESFYGRLALIHYDKILI
jgi:hypothetical protein